MYLSQLWCVCVCACVRAHTCAHTCVLMCVWVLPIRVLAFEFILISLQHNLIVPTPGVHVWLCMYVCTCPCMRVLLVLTAGDRRDSGRWEEAAAAISECLLSLSPQSWRQGTNLWQWWQNHWNWHDHHHVWWQELSRTDRQTQGFHHPSLSGLWVELLVSSSNSGWCCWAAWVCGLGWALKQWTNSAEQESSFMC